MKFIVLGAAGRMGQMHARHLRDLGHEVVEYDPVTRWPSLVNEIPNWYDEPADGVIIATPAEMHAEHLMKAIRHDFHVFIEKPICLIPHLPDARRAVQTAMEKRLVVAVGYNLRFHPIVKQVKKFISQGTMKPQFSTFQMRQNPERPLEHFLEEWASHEVDLALHLLGNWSDARLIRNETDFRQELQLMVNHHVLDCTSLILADAYTSPPVRSFTLVDEAGRSVTHDIERDHVWPEHYRAELDTWVERIKLSEFLPPGVFQGPLASGVDGLAVIDLLSRMTVKNGVRKSAIERAPPGI